MRTAWQVEHVGNVTGVSTAALPPKFDPNNAPPEPPPPPRLAPLRTTDPEVVAALAEVRAAVEAHTAWCKQLAALYSVHVAPLERKKEKVADSLVAKAAPPGSKKPRHLWCGRSLLRA